jgi:hypothetical protein
MGEDVRIRNPLEFDSKERVAYDLLMFHFNWRKDKDSIVENKDKLIELYCDFLRVVKGYEPKK